MICPHCGHETEPEFRYHEGECPERPSGKTTMIKALSGDWLEGPCLDCQEPILVEEGEAVYGIVGADGALIEFLCSQCYAKRVGSTPEV